MSYNVELKIISTASLLQLSKLKQEVSPSLGSDTLHFYTLHQSQVSIVNPTHKASVRVRKWESESEWEKERETFYFLVFPFLFPRRSMNNILHF